MRLANSPSENEQALVELVHQFALPIERGNKVKCKICDRKAVKSSYCEFHLGSYKNVDKKYGLWKTALEIPWKEYLSEIAKNPSTGKWAREVAEYLIKNGEEQDGTES